MFYVYVLKSIKTGEYYKGLTGNIEKRINEHIKGKSRTTKKMLPLSLVHVEIVPTRSEARRIEKYFKLGSGREIIKEIDS